MNVLQNNRGVTLIFVALGMFLFLLFLGVAVDTGWLVYVRAQGQARADSAALAAAAALKTPLADRQSKAEEFANTFSDKNSVVNETVDPANVVTPMTYDQENGNFAEASGWDLWAGNGPNCNAVRVTTAVPTPVFFSGIREVFGSGESGQENITVSAISHLPCPGLKLTSDEFGPFALRKCAWIEGNLAGACPITRDVFDVNTQQGTSALAKWTMAAPLQVTDSVSSLQKVLSETEFNSYLCSSGSKITVPVIDAISGGGDPCSDTSTSGTVVGFATICFARQTFIGEGEVPTTRVTATLQCGEVTPSSAGTGECFGTLASNPILVQ